MSPLEFEDVPAPSPAIAPVRAGSPGKLRRFAATIVARAGSLVLDKPLVLVCIALGAAACAKTGIFVFNLLNYELAIERKLPWLPELGDHGYLSGSLAGPIVARLLGIHGPGPYELLHGVILVGGIGLLLVTVNRRRGARATRLVAVALASAPVLVENLTNLGSYDVFTLMLGSFLALAEGWQAVLALSFGLGLFHFEMGVFIALALLMSGPKHPLGRRLDAACMFGGLLAGKLILSAYLADLGALGHNRFTDTLHWVSTDVGALSKLPIWVLLLIGLTIAYSLFGAAWPWVDLLLRKHGSEWGQPRRATWALLLLLVPALLADDVSRVYAMITWPTLLSLVLAAEHNGSETSLRRFAGIAVLGLVYLPSVSVYYWRLVVPDLRSPVILATSVLSGVVFAVMLAFTRAKPLAEEFSAEQAVVEA